MEKTLICLPFAGGSSTWYIRWAKYFDPSIDLETIELAGRGNRLRAPFYETLADAVTDIVHRIPREVFEREYYLFGHSMGNTLVYEIVYKIMEMGYPPPAHVFFSGRLSPEQCVSPRRIHALPLLQFKEEVMRLGGTSSEVFDEEELQQLFVPIMRADYKMLEEHHYKRYANPLPCSISVLYGTLDEHTPEDKIKNWKHYTSETCEFYSFSGGHFFIKEFEDAVVSIISKTIMNG
ncbi:hypothetical protein PMSD_25215 [Paenibacillus macquariensis subsp. defensor]|nr:hypothetical protein PMSD_25215 [Paenibacillus macquariensis subsp. defensor]